MKKNPVVSGVLLFLCLLYLFLPSFFIFLIIAGPIVVFMAIAFGIIYNIHQHNLRVAKGQRTSCVISPPKPSTVEADPIAKKRENFTSSRPQSVRRRNGKQNFVQEGEVEKDMIFSAFTNDALVDKAPLIEDNDKEIREVEVDSANHQAESSSSSSSASQHFMPNSQKVSEGRTTSVNFGDEDEEETQENNQRNIMDVGISETERNQRLESLIAKRTARKLLSMQVRRTLMNLGNNDPCHQIASILIPKHNHFNSNVSGEMISPTPGSAPSVLLPMHNPFDLPYDPQEEKPNLRGDSFQEEFMEAQKKDVMFTRHESFSLGPFFPGPGEFDLRRGENFCLNNFHRRSRHPERHELFRIRNHSGQEEESEDITIEPTLDENPLPPISPHDHDKQEDQTSKEVVNVVGIRHKDDRTNDQAYEQVACLIDIHHEDDKSDDQASEEVVSLVDIHQEDDKTDNKASEEIVNLVDIHHEDDKPEEVHEGPNLEGDVSDDSSSSSSSSELNVPFSSAHKDVVLRSLSFSIRRNLDRDNNVSCEDNPTSFENKRLEEHALHADKAAHHNHGDSIASDLQVEVSEIGSHSDRESEVERETPLDSEEKSAASLDVTRKEESETRWKEVRKVREQDIMEGEFSKINEKSEDDSISMPPKMVIEEDYAGSGLSPLKAESESQTHLVDLKGEDNYKEQVSQEVNRSYNVNDQEVLESDEKEILELVQHASTDAEAVETSECGPGHPETDHSNPSEQSEGEFQEEIEQAHILEASTLIENVNEQESYCEEIATEIGASMAEQGPSYPSSPSSPIFEEKVSINQDILSNVDQIEEAEGEAGVDNSFLDKVLAESTNPIVPHDAMHLTDGTKTPFPEREPETPREPTTTPKNRSMEEINFEVEEIPIASISSSPYPGTEKLELSLDPIVFQSGYMDLKQFQEPSLELDSSYSVKGSEFPATEDMKNFRTINNINANDSYRLKINEDSEGQSTKQHFNQVENKDTAESIQEHKSGSSVIIRNLLPEVVVGQASSSFFSPRSVLQKEYCIDRVTSSSLDQDIPMENNVKNGLQPENSKVTVNARLPSAVDSETLQEATSSIGKFPEDRVSHNINNSADDEEAEKMNLEPIDEAESDTKLPVNKEVVIDPTLTSDIAIELARELELTNSEDNLESTGVVEDDTKMSNADDVGPLKPDDQQNQDLDIPVPSNENKGSSMANLGKFAEETEMNSNRNDTAVSQNSEAESERLIPPANTAEELQNDEEANPS